MSRTDDPSDLTDEQWQIIGGVLPSPAKRRRKPIDRREILDAILYVDRTGCQWRALPHDVPKWKTVYNVFWQWRNQGMWQRIHDTLREKVRESMGKKNTPTAATANRSRRRKWEVSSGVTTRARSSPVASGTLPWTRWD